MKTLLILLFALFDFTIKAQNLTPILDAAKPGQRIDTQIVFDTNNELAYMPLSVIKGRQPGPAFVIVAGIHGYEYPPIVAVQQLLKEINTVKLKGTIIVLPVTSIASFYKRSPFISPIDGRNLNNTFPGSPAGSITERIAYWITKNLIPHTDVFLDIHGGDANEDLLPFICYYHNTDNKRQTDKARLLSVASGMEFVVSYPYTILKTEPAKYAFKQASQDGIVALSIEAGKLGTVQMENVELIKRAVYNMLGYLNMYGQMSAVEKRQNYLNQQSYVKVPKTGIFYSSIKSGDVIKRGQHIGYITDEFGNKLCSIAAPVSGTILYKIGTPPVSIGETLFCIGY